MSTTNLLPASPEYTAWLTGMLPDQGGWSEDQYLWLTDHTNRLVEFTDGKLEPLPMPTDRHQSILEWLFVHFHAYMQGIGGKVHIAPLRLQLRSGKFREPDMLLIKDARDPRRQNRFWTGADLTLEVVSEDQPDRDLVEKRHDYASAGVPEYWIVHPLHETITVLQLRGDTYVEHGVFARGSTATSALFPDVAIAVHAVFDAD